MLNHGKAPCALLIMLAAARAFGATDAPTVDIPFESFTLDNGLRVIVHEDRKAPIVAVSVWYHVGSKDERPGKTGFAHLFEHLMFNGSENHDDEYFKPLEDVGATALNGTTWYDRTNYFQNVPTPALELALWLESDRMGHLLGAITEEKLDEQRGVVQNEKRQGDNEPYGQVEYRMLEALFPEGHPYRWSTIGSMDDLNAASLEDVHEWFETYYGAANAVLVLAGDIDAATARPLAEKYFGDIDSGPPLKRLRAWVPTRSENTYEEMYDRVPHERVYRFWAVPGRLAREVSYLNLAAIVLGDGKNSRLYKSLVYDSQIVTGVSVGIQTHELSSFFEVDMRLKPGSDRDEALEIVDREMARFLRDGPTGDELERARSKINSSVIRGLEQVGGTGGKAATLARGEIYADDPAFFKAQLARTNAARPEQIVEAARKWIAQGYHQLTVLPFPEYRTAGAGADRSVLPVVGPMPDLSFPEIHRDRLSNGIEIVLAERHTVPVVNIVTSFDAGYAADAGGKLGVSSFTLAMLDEGTRRLDALEISAETEALGASISAGSNLDVSSVNLSALKVNLDRSLRLYADIVRNPAFSESEIERLRGRWLASIQQEKSQPVSIALRTLPPLIYGPGHAYGIPFTGSGTEESVTSLTRADLAEFHRRWLRPDNAKIFVVGDTSMEEIKPLLERYFGDWRAPREPAPQKNLAPVRMAKQSRVYLIDRPGAQQTLILAGHLAPPSGDARDHAIQVMNDILGGQFTARVNMNLREDKGWAYGAYTILWNARGQRPWLVYAPVQTDRTVDSIRELQKEISEYLGTRPAEADEMSRIVRNEVNSLPGKFETGGAVLGALVSNDRFDRPDDYVLTLKSRFEALTLAEIRAAARDVLQPDRLRWVVVGDREAIEAPLRELGLGELVLIDADGKALESEPASRAAAGR